MVKIALDAGHGYNTPGKRSPIGEREWSFNNKVLLACAAELNKYQNVQILRLDDPTGKTDVPLVTRTNKANRWKADVLVSIHHNANTSKWGSWGGVETFVYRKNNGQAHKLAEIINPLIVNAMGLRNRGVKAMNLHMVRASNMPAILTEGGFMDSTTDIGALRSDAKLKAQGIAIAQGLVKFFGLKKKSVGDIVLPTDKKELNDMMDKKLDGTRQKDMVALTKKAYEEGIFSVDHSKNVPNMTYFEALQLLMSYTARKK
ncbi:N-acetylmuramoyl-L-alanine amidase [Savagea sp. SN6]|uniref:N-acetylmuramoyl-L-alanine amidase n=1 Tax=Savagea serpentis TaxID=2785297 RepID=A0A8J7KS66_9BACL|nr:N-acetylmuramoyl-L-alanine amidase [Savagea serpentis]MBF4500244.1 N-acetylmuramoyl-L-alanine amidase [Savagea serpentis]